jgi:hypothetical protein
MARLRNPRVQLFITFECFTDVYKTLVKGSLMAPLAILVD